MPSLQIIGLHAAQAPVCLFRAEAADGPVDKAAC
jgi:hypothetical protein